MPEPQIPERHGARVIPACLALSRSGQPKSMVDPMPPVVPGRLRALLTEATEHRRRGDIALAEYVEMLAAVALRTSIIQRGAA